MSDSSNNTFDQFKTPEEVQVFVSKLSNDTKKLLLDELLKEKFPDIEEYYFRINDKNPDNRALYTCKQKIDDIETEVKYRRIFIDDLESTVREILDFWDEKLNKKYKNILDAKAQYFTRSARMNETKKAGKKVPLYISSESARQEAEEEIERLRSQWYDHVQIVNIGKLIRELWITGFLIKNKISLWGYFHVDNIFGAMGKEAIFWSAARNNQSSLGAYFIDFDPHAGTNKAYWNIISDYTWYGFSGRCIKE